MKEELHNILENPGMRENPFSVPEGYFSKLENNIHILITSKKEKKSVWNILKPVFTLAFTFIIIYGIGYGVLSLTNNIKTVKEVPTDMAIIESGYINTNFIDYYENSDSSLISEEETLDEEEIVSYLLNHLSSTDLAYLYASLE